MMLPLECGVESVHFLLKDGKATDKVSFLEALFFLNYKSGTDLCQSLGPACANGGWIYHTADGPNPVVLTQTQIVPLYWAILELDTTIC